MFLDDIFVFFVFFDFFDFFGFSSRIWTAQDPGGWLAGWLAGWRLAGWLAGLEVLSVHSQTDLYCYEQIWVALGELLRLLKPSCTTMPNSLGFFPYIPPEEAQQKP